jgi:hypothetical protein
MYIILNQRRRGIKRTIIQGIHLIAPFVSSPVPDGRIRFIITHHDTAIHASNLATGSTGRPHLPVPFRRAASCV